MGHHRGEIVVAPFEARSRAMKQFRRNRQIAFTRKTLGDVANMRIDSERLLEHEQARRRACSRGPGHISAHGSAVAHAQIDMLGMNIHANSPWFRESCYQSCLPCASFK